MLEAFFAACVPFYNRRNRDEQIPIEAERRHVSRKAASKHLYDSIDRLTAAVEKKNNDDLP